MATTVPDQAAPPSRVATPAAARAYRDYLLPLIANWRARAARVAIFGTGPHTADLLAIVPELESPALAAYVESNAAAGATYRGRPVVPLASVEKIANVVVCSSYAHEAQQLRLLDAYAVKGHLSHPPHVTAGIAPHYLFVPTFGYPVILPPPPDEHVEALELAFEHDRPAFDATLRTLSPFFAELKELPHESVDEVTPHWNNGYFGGSDARVAYGMVRVHRPRRILEIGSGNSTKFLRLAIERNGGGTELVSIDPTPRAEIDRLCERVIRQPLQRVPIETFDVLESGDILFMDGTHQVFHGTDSVFFYLRVLPRIAPGVRVHIHDITLPFEYPDEFIERYYAEQYVLAAQLLGGDRWRTTVPVNFLHQRGVLPEWGTSFWMERA